MDKVKVNNQVVKMRRHVKRAKLFAINKFTKQLKQLQNRKGNDSQIEKSQRKIERLLEKVKILKKMVPDFVSKKALSKEQDWNTILTQKNIPLEDQCLALLANDCEIQKEVEKFHAEECQLVEKIPTLLLEWEVKSKMPKSPDIKKKAADIKKQKLDKIAKRKKSQFKGATFPNNVAVEKCVKTPHHKKRKLSENSDAEETDVNEKNQNENPESMEGYSNDDDQLNSESSNNSCESEPEEFSSNAEKNNKMTAFEKQVICEDPPTEGSSSDVNSSDEEDYGDSSIDDAKSCNFSEVKSAENSATRPSIYERLHALANTDPRKLKAKNKSNLNSKNTKAIKVLDLNELQNAEEIPIQNSTIDSEELTAPTTAAPKKDSFFLNGDEEVESSNDEESNSNNFRNFQSKCKFSNSDRNTKGDKFKRKGFGKKPFNSSKEKDFNQNENRFQNKRGKHFNRNENRFQKNKGDFQFKNKKFDNKSKGNSNQFKHFNPSQKNDSSNHRRENKKGTMANSMQPNEKGDKNANLHPSWEAKNKLKEAAKSGFKGKRIVFD